MKSQEDQLADAKNDDDDDWMGRLPRKLHKLVQSCEPTLTDPDSLGANHDLVVTVMKELTTAQVKEYAIVSTGKGVAKATEGISS